VIARDRVIAVIGKASFTTDDIDNTGPKGNLLSRMFILSPARSSHPSASSVPLCFKDFDLPISAIFGNFGTLGNFLISVISVDQR
jgi:hypothetical protein